MRYTKGPLTYAAQLQQLEQRGLHIPDPQRATYYLERVGYYRLMGYLFPLRLPGSDNYRPGAAFEEAVALYEFDQTLRSLIMEATGGIEVAVRTAVTYRMAHAYGAFGYGAAENIAYDRGWHARWLSTVESEVERSRETFITHYKATYTNPGHPRVPIWMASEVMSFGSLSKLVQAMHPSDRKGIAAVFGAPAPVFSSWIHAISAVRNIAAHHGRMWNRVLGIIPARPRTASWQREAESFPEDRTYFALLAIKTLLASCAADVTGWRDLVSDHLRPLLATEEHRRSLGAPFNWDQHPLWR